ncbi:hypothetical protein J4230_01945 [Candidatus Woesearchaeota archaeon]|nr:hypothetical protein [Candidatus Woesearchaeota archaeon]
MASSKFFKKLNSFNYEPVVHILGIIIVVLFIINLFFITSLTSSLKQKVSEANEAARPAKLDLIIINAPSCDKCFDIKSIVANIKSGNVNITSEEVLNFKDAFLVASEYISKYDIEKLPTVIVKGELNKTKLHETLISVGDAYVFTKQTAPYFNIGSNSIKGFVTVTIVNADGCSECADIGIALDQINTGGIVIQDIINLSEKESKELTDKYKIKKLPSLILSSDASEYSLIKQSWNSVGSEEDDGSFVLRNFLPPYKNLETGKIDGLVSLTYVVDSSCSECYNVSVHKNIINSYGLKIAGEKTLDVNTPEGLEYTKLNGINLVPTAVLSSDAKLYSAFYRVFTQVSNESNGNLVFTSVELMGTYKDLQSGEVITPKQQEVQ